MEQQVSKIWQALRIAFIAVPIIAGLDKFTNFLTDWEQYLNPMLVGLLPFSAATFMKVVGVVEIVAGILVFARPRLGAYIVTAWLVGIALNLIASGRFLDVAVRDLMMALAAFSLATLTPVAEAAVESRKKGLHAAEVRRVALSVMLGALLLGGTLQASAGDDPGMDHAASLSPKAQLREDMRKLWEDHITWTRLYIVSAVDNLPDKGAAAARLLQNQADIGNAIKPIYGDAAGNQLTALLRGHILVAADLIEKVKANDAQAKEVTAKWYSNADSIAQFLAAANPVHWKYTEMRTMMHDHLDLTTAEVVARLKKDWAGDIAAYDKVHGQILAMADMLSEGIVGQFPAKFQ